MVGFGAGLLQEFRRALVLEPSGYPAHTHCRQLEDSLTTLVDEGPAVTGERLLGHCRRCGRV
jgi:hypothetical protein